MSYLFTSESVSDAADKPLRQAPTTITSVAGWPAVAPLMQHR